MGRWRRRSWLCFVSLWILDAWSEQPTLILLGRDSCLGQLKGQLAVSLKMAKHIVSPNCLATVESAICVRGVKMSHCGKSAEWEEPPVASFCKCKCLFNIWSAFLIVKIRRYYFTALFLTHLVRSKIFNSHQLSDFILIGLLHFTLETALLPDTCFVLTGRFPPSSQLLSAWSESPSGTSASQFMVSISRARERASAILTRPEPR